MKKQKIIVIIFIVLIGIIILSVQTCKSPTETKYNNDGWELLKKEKEKEILKKDSLYLDLKVKTDLKLKEIEKEKVANEKKYQKQLNDLKKKYDKEYSKVTDTPIDSTISISTKFLSEEIDYSKFQK